MSLKNNVFSSFGSSLEWCDFALYGYFGPIFAQIFFINTPNQAWMNLLQTYLIFAIGFAARPIGALIFGYMGDKFGRMFSLKLTPLLLIISTILLACLPTYQTIGYYAVILLLLIRIFQGILIGGEFAGNIVYLCEYSFKHRYFWGSIGSCTGSFGIILASAIATIFFGFLTHDAMLEYGWRAAYVSCIPLGLIAFKLRLKIIESSGDAKCNKASNPLITSFKYHKKTFFFCLGLTYLHATSFYFVFVFLPVFLSKIRHMSTAASLAHNTSFLFLHLCLIPAFGLLINKIGGIKSIKSISLIFIIFSIPLFYLISYGSMLQIQFAMSIFSILTAFNAAVIPGLLVEIIPRNVRYTVLAFSFNIMFGIFGGLVPFIALLLIKKSHSIMLPSVYLTFIAFITLITGYLLSKSRKNHEVREISRFRG